MLAKIETERFNLRLVEKKDSKAIFNILNNDKVITNLNMKKPESIEDVDNLIEDYLKEYEKQNKFPFAIIDKNKEDLVGVFLIKLDLFDDDCFEFTVYIGEDYWNKGIYTEVLPYMIKFAFEEIKTGNFRGFVMQKNTASGKVLKRSGFVLEKVFKVESLDGMIESYLMTKDDYFKNID